MTQSERKSHQSEVTRKELASLSNEELDEMVHDLKGEEAAAINNGGREEQIDYLLRLPHGENACECERPGYFCSGVPGIIARVENAKLLPGAAVERCDLCCRYDSDEAALAKLVGLGIASSKNDT